MRSLFISFIVVALLSVSSSSYGDNPFDYQKQVFDFGHVALDFTVFHTFKYANETDHPVKILEADANCDCTTVSLLDSLLEPGDTAYFALSFNTRDYYGATSKSFIVKTDDPENKEFKFYYISTIGQWTHNLRPNPQSLFFLPGKKGLVVKVPNMRFDEIELKNFEQYDSSFVVKVLSDDAGKGAFLELEVAPVDGLGRGTHLSTLTLEIEVSGEEKPTILSLPVKIVRY